jgi:hypothetical protein
LNIKEESNPPEIEFIFDAIKETGTISKYDYFKMMLTAFPK